MDSSVLSKNKLSDIATTNVRTTHRNNTLADVKQLFARYDINHLPVVDNENHLIGMISSSDIARITHWKAYFQPALEANKVDRLLSTLLVEDIMRTKVYSLGMDASCEDAAKLIDEKRIHCIPITDKANKLQAIVTAHDMIRLAFLQ